MSQYTKIIHKQNSTAGEVPTLTDQANTNELDLGEIAINTHDGKMFIRKEDGNNNFSLVEVGKPSEVENVLYVSKSGNDNNDGKTLSSSFATIKAALAFLRQEETTTPGSTLQTTIFVKSGTYIEDNSSDAANGNPMGGMVVPPFVSIVGDNLRTTRVRAQHSGNDLFYVQNGSYITNITYSTKIKHYN